MGIQTVITLYGILGLIGAVTLVAFVVLAVAGRVSPTIGDEIEDVRDRSPRMALSGAFVVALLATGGSLYMSEVAEFTPCTLCWYQRIAMYPLVVILGIAVLRRDLDIRIYAIPIALIGAAISTYHYILEWFPAVDTGACTVGVPCTLVWFREFGFVSLPFLALVAFLLVVALLLVPTGDLDDEVAEEPHEDTPST